MRVCHCALAGRNGGCCQDDPATGGVITTTNTGTIPALLDNGYTLSATQVAQLGDIGLFKRLNEMDWPDAEPAD